MVLQPNSTHHRQREVCVAVSQVDGDACREDPPEDEDASALSQRDSVVRVQEGRAHGRVHFAEGEAPDAGAEEGTGEVCRLQPLVLARIARYLERTPLCLPPGNQLHWFMNRGWWITILDGVIKDSNGSYIFFLNLINSISRI